jgi:hypothetical protein
MDMRRPASALKSDDFPTLGRPIITTWGSSIANKSRFFT